MREIPLQGYVLVFADMEAPTQWPWESMRALKGLGHDSVDLYTLFPIDMAIMRLLAYEERHADRYAAELTRFFGTDNWRALRAGRTTAAQAPQLRRALVRLYLHQLRTLWGKADEMIDVYFRGKQRLYKMLFASDHPVAEVIAGWIKQRGAAAQQSDLFS
jgi:three-Cys-motif partner protein